MSKQFSARCCKGLLIAGFFAIQMGHTLLDANSWPFCSYNMFNRALPEQFQTFKVKLHEGDRQTSLMDVWGMMPLEFFRVNSALATVYLDSDDAELQQRFAQKMLGRLNAHPWAGFDEIYPAYRPASPAGFNGFELYLVDFDLGQTSPDGSFVAGKEHLVYRFIDK